MIPYDQKRFHSARNQLEVLERAAEDCRSAGAVIGMAAALVARNCDVWHAAEDAPPTLIPAGGLSLSGSGIQIDREDGPVLLPYARLRTWDQNHFRSGAPFLFDVETEQRTTVSHLLAPARRTGDEGYAIATLCAVMTHEIAEDDMVAMSSISGRIPTDGSRRASISPALARDEVPGDDHVLTVAGHRIRIGSIVTLHHDQDDGVTTWNLVTDDGRHVAIAAGDLGR